MTQDTKITIGIVAHVDAGKTTLSEQLLYKSGVIRSLGRVDTGNTFLDTDKMEKDRGITIFSKQAQLVLEGKRFVLLDTPGHVDFSAEMERCLQVLDAAVLVVSGADGVQSHTQTLWRLLSQYQIPTILFVNKMDQSICDKESIKQNIQEKLGHECVDFSWDEEDLKEEQRVEKKTEFLESIAMTDEAVLEAFLETGDVDLSQVGALVCERKLFPCFYGSALKDFGLEELMHGIASYFMPRKYGTAFGARIFKITRDEAGARLTHLKITGGSLKVKTILAQKEQEREEKVNQIRIYNGDKYELLEEAVAGEICAVTGLSFTRPGEGLGIEELETKPQLEPVLQYKVTWPRELVTAQVVEKLRLIEEENPELHISWDEELSELLVQLMGDVQIEVLANLVKERFGFEIGFTEGDVVYLETIANTVEGVGHFEPLRHYAEAHLLLEPLPRGEGLKFALGCSQDMLSLNWQRLIEQHLMEKTHRGVLTRAPITDMKITVAAGRAHNKHTEGGDFRQATYRAVRQGLMQAESILLEPYYAFRIQLPYNLLGRVMTDVEQMSGTCEAPIIDGEEAIITGRAPVATIRNYAKDLMAFTQGHGRILLQYAGYDTCHNTQEVIERKHYDPLHDLRNSPDSVFCEHGSGFIVPWDEVFEYMHVESVLSKKQDAFDDATMQRLAMQAAAANKKQAAKFGQDEAQLDAIFEKTYGPRRDRAQEVNRIVRKTLSSEQEAENEAHKKVRSPKKKEEYLLVDGYNIIFAWEELNIMAKTNIDAARAQLADALCDYQAMMGMQLILVFDAYKVKGNLGQMQPYHNISIVYTKEAETADQYIEKTAHKIGHEKEVTVATSDGLEQLIVWGNGCRVMSARQLKQELQRVKELLYSEFAIKRTEE